MGGVTKDDGWRLNDQLWKQLESLLPARKQHPLGCHNPRVPDRDAMNGILFVLRTGCQWNALDATGIGAARLAEIGFMKDRPLSIVAALLPRVALARSTGSAGPDPTVR